VNLVLDKTRRGGGSRPPRWRRPPPSPAWRGHRVLPPAPCLLASPPPPSHSLFSNERVPVPAAPPRSLPSHIRPPYPTPCAQASEAHTHHTHQHSPPTVNLVLVSFVPKLWRPSRAHNQKFDSLTHVHTKPTTHALRHIPSKKNDTLFLCIPTSPPTYALPVLVSFTPSNPPPYPAHFSLSPPLLFWVPD